MTDIVVNTTNIQSVVNVTDLEISVSVNVTNVESIVRIDYGLSDATKDGKIYGRKDGAWVEITQQSSGITDIFKGTNVDIDKTDPKNPIIAVKANPELTDVDITSLSQEATYSASVWIYLVDLFTTVPKSVKSHLVKLWQEVDDLKNSWTQEILDVDFVPYIDLLVDESVTIYGDSLINVPIVNGLTVKYLCDIGQQVGNNYTISPTSANVGNHNLNVIYKNNNVLIGVQNITLRISEKETIGAKKMLFIGDSLTNSGFQYIAPKIISIFSGISFNYIGTQGTTYKHEGHSGWSYATFIGPTSPFYKNGGLDIGAYFIDNGLDIPDIVHIRLGINDTFGFCNINTYPNGISEANITTILNNAKTLIDAFLNYSSNYDIVISIPTICENTGDGWNNNYDESVYNQNLYIRNIHKFWMAYIEMFGNYAYSSRIKLIYDAINLDRNDGYPKTDGVHTNGVHPDQSGYEQLAQGTASGINELLASLSVPTNLAIIWVNDYLQITWDDNTGGLAQYEIWESKNGDEYILVTTTSVGAESYNNYTEQNALMQVKIRAKNGSLYSAFVESSQINTPLVFISDQTTLTTLTLNTLNISVGKTVNVDWGDGTNANYSGNNSTITKNYGTAGLKYVKLTGDLNSIIRIDIRNQSKAKGSLTKWNRPTSLIYMDLLSCSFTGDWTNNDFVSGLTYIQIGQTAGAGLSGDWSDFIINQSLSSFNAAASASTNKASGDLSGWVIPSTCVQVYIPFHNFTKLPRGNFLGLNATIGMYANSNDCDQAEIDNFLLYLQSFFTTNPPIKNQLYKLDGTGMAIPSATGLAAKAAVEQLFTNAGYTVTINVNS